MVGYASIVSYFANHITQAYSDYEAQAAVFKDLSSESCTACAQIIDNVGKLVYNSDGLAKKLHAIIQTKKSIKAGNIAFCIYRQGGTKANNLAILKFDPGEVLLPRTEVGTTGRYVTWHAGSNGTENRNKLA